jgi:hypothetical protein
VRSFFGLALVGGVVLHKSAERYVTDALGLLNSTTLALHNQGAGFRPPTPSLMQKKKCNTIPAPPGCFNYPKVVRKRQNKERHTRVTELSSSVNAFIFYTFV